MNGNLQHVTLSFVESNGDGIAAFDMNNTISAIVPSVGDKVNVDGNYREVTEIAYTYGTKSIIVMVYLKELQ